MSKLTLTVIVVLHLIYGSCASPVQEVELPQNIKICRRSENKYAACLLNAIQEAWPLFVKGVPELGFPSIDPLKIDRFERNVNFGSLVGSALFDDISYRGFGDAKFLSVQPRLAGNHVTIDMNVKIPKLVLKADYNIQATVESINIGGKGHLNITLEGFSTTWGIDGYVKNDRLILKHFHDDPQIKGLKIYFSDIFNGNQALNNAALVLANQAWPLLFNAVKPIYGGFSDSFLTDYLNRNFFSKVSVSKLFPN